jgi:hypothetical protein
MRTSDNTGQVSGNRACFVSAETVDLDFEILRHQFPQTTLLSNTRLAIIRLPRFDDVQNLSHK